MTNPRAYAHSRASQSSITLWSNPARSVSGWRFKNVDADCPMCHEKHKNNYSVVYKPDGRRYLKSLSGKCNSVVFLKSGAADAHASFRRMLRPFAP